MQKLLRKPLTLHRSLIAQYGRHLAMALATAALLLGMQLAGYLIMAQQRATRIAADTETMRAVELNRGLNEAQDALFRFRATGQTASLDGFYTSLKEAETARDGMMAMGRRSPTERRFIEQRVGTLMGDWRRTIELQRAGRVDDADDLASSDETERALRETRRLLREIIAANRDSSAALTSGLWALYNALFWLQILFAALMLLSLGRSIRQARSEALARTHANNAEAMARRRLELLFQMHDMLQSAEDHRDANAILVATAAQLAPGVCGALYIFANSGDRLNLSASWPQGCGAIPQPATIAPSDCWALKRGKLHRNAPGDATLRCLHASQGDEGVLEIPMIARGQVLGMLLLSDGVDDNHMPYEELVLIGSALADGMGLALANIALRERLRNQALRDGLTGLYNRRYMEDTLERFVEVAKNGGPETALVMIDLDHFKSINDEHGHAAGDAVLRDVGAILMSALRKADIACRYGGEELAVIMPSCDLTVAVERAKQLCARIEALSDTYGFRVSASMGVATAPAHARSADELVVVADKALYVAKANGRNQVRHAGEEGGARRGARALQDKLAAA